MRPFRSAVLLCAVMLAAAVMPAGASAAARYDVVILPPLPGGSESIARDLNDAGVAVGNATAEGDEPGFASRAVRWVDGVPEELVPGDDASFAAAINDFGDIAGNGSRGAYLWVDGRVTLLGSLERGGGSEANGLNDTGTVVGTAGVGAGFHGFVWRDGVMTDLGTLGGALSLAQDVNDAGLVVGTALAENAGTGSPVVWEDGDVRVLPTLGGPGGSANAVTDRGLIAGFADPDPVGITFHAALWRPDGTIVDLHGFGTDSLAEDLNEAGQVVGGVVLEDGSARGFLWEDGTMHDLNDLIPADVGLTITTASAVNEHGQIAGFGTVAGEPRGYVLTPRTGGDDVTPPTVDAPAEIVVPATSPKGRAVDVEATVTVTDDQDPAPALACEPPPGTVFTIDSPTPVVCTATDAAGNATSVTIDVVVLSATKQLRNLKAVVRHLGLGDAAEAALLRPLNQALFLRRTDGRAAACPALDRFAGLVTGTEAAALRDGEERLLRAADRIGRVFGCG